MPGSSTLMTRISAPDASTALCKIIIYYIYYFVPRAQNFTDLRLKKVLYTKFMYYSSKKSRHLFICGGPLYYPLWSYGLAMVKLLVVMLFNGFCT